MVKERGDLLGEQGAQRPPLHRVALPGPGCVPLQWAFAPVGKKMPLSPAGSHRCEHWCLCVCVCLCPSLPLSLKISRNTSPGEDSQK